MAIFVGILGEFMRETYKLMSTLLFGELGKIGLSINVLDLVDMALGAQLAWVVALAGVSLFLTTGTSVPRTSRGPTGWAMSTPTTSS